MWIIIGIYFVRQIRNLVKSKMIRSNGCYFDLQWQKWAPSFSTVYALHRLLFPGTAARQTLTWLCIRALASACSAVCRSVCIQNSLCLPCCSVPCLSSASSLISVDPCKPFYCFYVISCILHLHQEANLIQKCQRVKMKIMIASIFTGFKQPNCSSEELQVWICHMVHPASDFL